MTFTFDIYLPEGVPIELFVAAFSLFVIYLIIRLIEFFIEIFT